MQKYSVHAAAAIGAVAVVLLIMRMSGIEVCWIWQNGCENGDQWAAWVQAVGSIGAIVVAVLLSRHDKGEERRQAIRSTKDFGLRLMGLLADLREDASAANRLKMKKHKYQLAELLDFSRGVRTEVMPSEQMLAAFDLRYIVTEAQALCADFEVNPPHYAQKFSWEFEKLRESTHKIMVDKFG